MAINYSINQNYCYILIIPGFGIVSTVVAASSNKSIFGQDGPLISRLFSTTNTAPSPLALDCHVHGNRDNRRIDIKKRFFKEDEKSPLLSSKSANFADFIFFFAFVGAAFFWLLSLFFFYCPQISIIFGALALRGNKKNWAGNPKTSIGGKTYKKDKKKRKVVALMKNKEHLTKEGLEKIRSIKMNMNRGRIVPIKPLSLGDDDQGSDSSTGIKPLEASNSSLSAQVVILSSSMECEYLSYLCVLVVGVPLLMQQTICGKLVALIVQATFVCTLIFKKVNLQNVRMFVQGIIFPTNNPLITKAPQLSFSTGKSQTSLSKRLSMQVGISEAIRLFSTNSIPGGANLFKNNECFASLWPEAQRAKANKKSNDEIKFNEWLAGVIDGDGCFQLSKKGYSSLEITMETRDKHCLYIIKQRFGGSIKIKSDVNWLRYRLHHKEGILHIINAVNGLIRNPNRILQLGKICEKYNIDLKYPEPLTYDNAWFSGFFDADGSIYLNLLSSQVFITVSKKNKFLLDNLVSLYGGTIYPMVKVGAFKWTVFRKDEIVKLLVYFEKNPSRSAKHKRLKLLEKYYELRALKAHRASNDSLLGKNWKRFLKNWENYK